MLIFSQNQFESTEMGDRPEDRKKYQIVYNRQREVFLKLENNVLHPASIQPHDDLNFLVPRNSTVKNLDEDIYLTSKCVMIVYDEKGNVFRCAQVEDDWTSSLPTLSTTNVVSKIL